jgi:hypothetical protein
LAGHDLRAAPAIRDVMHGIRRTHGTAPAKKEAAVTEVVRDAAGALARRGGSLLSRRLSDRDVTRVVQAGVHRRWL